MFKVRTVLLATVGALALVSAAVAKDAAPVNKEITAALNDANKFSKDGAEAFRDIHMARLAIYSADPALAKKKIGEAAAALEKASANATLIEKSEAELMSKAGAPADAKASTEKVKWLPFDGTLSLAEDFVASAEKAKAVAEANAHLAKGEKKEALERLKLADIDLMYTTALAPMSKTVAGVATAKEELEKGKYYEANATLKGVEDAVRYVTVSVLETPKGDKSAKGAKDAKDTKPAAKSPEKPAK
ncbi:MAG: YfdX family protein [Rhodoblastus sp.]